MVKPLVVPIIFILVLKYCQGTLENIKISNEIYLLAASEVIEEKVDNLRTDTLSLEAYITECSDALNETSEACQYCLEVVNCESNGGSDRLPNKENQNILHQILNPVITLGKKIHEISRKKAELNTHVLDKIDGTLTDDKTLLTNQKGLKKLSLLDESATGTSGSNTESNRKRIKRADIISRIKDGADKIAKKAVETYKKAEKAVKDFGKKVSKKADETYKKAEKAVKDFGKKVSKKADEVIRAVAQAVIKDMKRMYAPIQKRYERKPRNRRSAEGSFIDMAMTDAKTCMSQCASCLPFTNDDQLQVIQSVCANGLVDIVNKLTSEAVVLSSFANDIRTSTSDLLQQMQVESDTGLLTNVSALIQGEFRSFSTDIVFDQNNPSLMYKILAEYIFQRYLLL